MKSRECDNFDKLVDLIVADRLKDSLTCLKYCLSLEGSKVLSSAELAVLADTFDANYSSDGKYRGNAVLSSRDDGLVAILPDLSFDLHRIVPLQHLMWERVIVTAPLQPESLRVILTTAIMATGQA